MKSKNFCFGSKKPLVQIQSSRPAEIQALRFYRLSAFFVDSRALAPNKDIPLLSSYSFYISYSPFDLSHGILKYQVINIISFILK